MNTYKATLRIPTEEQYAYIEVQVEATPESIVSAHREFSALVRPVDGLPERDFNKVVDAYLQEKGMSEGTMLSLGKAQQWWIKTLDKAKARLSNKSPN